MNNDIEQNSIKDKILGKIKTGKVKMRPKLYFVFKNIIFVGVIVVLSALIIYLISFIVFAMDSNGAWLLTSFGLRGVFSLIASLPWFLILIVLLSMVLIEVLMKNFKFAYHRPLIYSILGIMVIFLALGFFTYMTSFHKSLSCLCEKTKIPVASSLYGNYKQIDLPNFYRGEVAEVKDEEIKLKKSDGEIIELIITSKSQEIERERLKKGDKIMLIGEKRNSIINIANFKKDINCGCDACNQFPKKLK